MMATATTHDKASGFIGHNDVARIVQTTVNQNLFSTKRPFTEMLLLASRGGPAFLDRFRGRDKWNSIGYAATASS